MAAAIPSLSFRTLGHHSVNEDASNPRSSTQLIVKHYDGLKEDLSIMSKLLHIARNLLVTPEPEVPQDLCAAVNFDRMVHQVIKLCVSVTSKGYDGESLDDKNRAKLNEITDAYKKVLVTALQHAHNWTAKNDRNKMSFWLDVLFDEDLCDDPPDYPGMDFHPATAKVEISHWLERNAKLSEKAQILLKDYVRNHSSQLPGPLPAIRPLCCNWLPKEVVNIRADDPKGAAPVKPEWDAGETDKFKQDAQYGRVSREIDTWWLNARDPNYEHWLVPMPSVEFAKQRTDNCKANLVRRVNSTVYPEDHEVQSANGHMDEELEEDEQGPPEDEHDYEDPILDDEEIEDDDSYGEGPMTGLLTEVPNILDPKQIEALHMIVKSCILDTPNGERTQVGENLQKTRCRMFLATDCGKSLLREMLVFIAVWEKDESSLIFQITTQIIEAIHHSALLPYTWDSLRIPKDIISPAQTVLLRLINHMFQAAKNKTIPTDPIEMERNVKLVYFLFASFRSRIVPECVALMHLQGQIRQNHFDPADFPVDNWDMERAKDGLAQFLDFLKTVVDTPDIRKHLIDWEVIYELITLLKALDIAVEKKAIVELPDRSANRPTYTDANGQHIDDNETWDHYDANTPNPGPPPMQDAWQFPWAGIKVQILMIVASLLQPPPGKSGPGNADVQKQIIAYDGTVALLNCCVYDSNNPYCRERVQICLKWLMDGSKEANDFVRQLVAVKPPPNGGEIEGQGQGQGHGSVAPPQLASDTGKNDTSSVRKDGKLPGVAAMLDNVSPEFSFKLNNASLRTLSQPLQPGQTTSLRIDGIRGEVNVQVRNPEAKTSNNARAAAGSQNHNPATTPHHNMNQPPPPLPPLPSGAAAAAAAGGSQINLSSLLNAGFGAGINGAALGAGIARLAAAGLLSGEAPVDASSILAPLQNHAAQLSAAAGNLSAAAAASGASETTAAARSRHEELLRDIVALADEAARLALGHSIGDVNTATAGNINADIIDLIATQGEHGMQQRTANGGQQRPQGRPQGHPLPPSPGGYWQAMPLPLDGQAADADETEEEDFM